jgi:hypothetical protein
MQDHNLFSIYTKRLNKADLNYIVTGSVAGIIYGEPRLTHDVDIILHLKITDLNSLVNIFSNEEFYLPPIEVIRTEMSRTMRGHFNIIHHETGFKADIYLAGNDPLHIFAFKNLKTFKINSEDVYVAPPEYVIIRKLEFYDEGKSQKHLIDIKSILKNCPLKINKIFIMTNIKSKEIKKLFNSIVKSTEVIN